jgi:DNA-binding CsgD family transcriptional regulator
MGRGWRVRALEGIGRSSYLRATVTAVRARDVKALLEFVALGYEAEGTEPFPPSVLWELVRLIPSDAVVGYQESDIRECFEIIDVVEIVGEPPSAAVKQAYLALSDQNPLRCGVRSREERVLRLSDFMSTRQRRRLDYYVEVWRPHGIEDALRLWLPAPTGYARTIYLERSGRYTDREKTLLTLLRPHLIRIRAAREARAAQQLPGLTEREGEVLRRVSEGRTNAEIAALLYISPYTVRTHLEHIFEKLGVHTRTAAAARFNGAHSNGA